MGDLTTLISGIVEFPEKGVTIFGFISKFVFILLEAVYNGGVIGYGLAIIFFTIILRLMLVPLDFANRYFTRKNAKAMEKFKPEIDAIKEQYAGDPIAINKATREVYRKNNHKMGGFCAFSIINLALTLIIFMTVFYSLRTVADYNVNAQFKNHLQPIYAKYELQKNTEFLDEEETIHNPLYELDFHGVYADPDLKAAFNKDVLAAYNKSRVGFLWVTNIWKQDTWVSKTHNYTGFYNATLKVEGSLFHQNNYQNLIDARLDENPNEYKDNFKAYITKSIQKSNKKTWASWASWADVPSKAQSKIHDEYIRIITESAFDAYYKETETQYNAIFAEIKPTQKGWNGLLLLIILAGAVTYFSTVINMKLMNSGKKKEDPAKSKEIKVQYSMRDAKTQTEGPTKPAIDPAKMTKIMKFALPIMMIFFTFISTAALAIYIISSSVFAALLTMAMKYPVNKLLDWQEKRAAKRGDAPPPANPDQVVINPHTKYFRKRK